MTRAYSLMILGRPLLIFLNQIIYQFFWTRLILILEQKLKKSVEALTIKLECIFDYSQTKNQELALDTQIIMEQNELNKQIASEYRRKINITIVYKII